MKWKEWLNSRDAFKRIGATVLIAALILVFALFSYFDQGQMGTAGYAARVNSEIISIRDFQNQYNQMSQFYSQLFGGQFDADPTRDARLREMVLGQLVSREAVIQNTAKSGLQVSNAEVRDFLIKTFQQDGKFKRELYDNFLANQGMAAGRFETEIKRDFLFSRVQDLFTKAVKASPLETEKMKSLDTVKVNLEFVRLSSAQMASKMPVSAAELSAFMSSTESSSKIQNYFELNKEEFSKPEQVKARHILVKANSGNFDDALSKIKAIRARLDKEDFAKVASEVSEDLGSQKKGGDLGFFERGRMVKEFEDAAFGMEAGKISEPIKTQYGYHIIKVEEKLAAETKVIDQVRDLIAKQIVAQEKAEKVLESLRQSLESGDRARVEALVKEAGAKWDETGLFSLSEDRVPKLPELDEAIGVAAALKPEQPLHKKPVLLGGEFFVLRLKSRQNLTVGSDVNFQEKLSGQRGREAFTKWADEIVKKSKVDKNPALIQNAI